MAAREAPESPKSVPRRAAAAAKDVSGLLSPRFRSAAALAGWDEESLLLAALVVEDTPVRESRRKRRPSSAGGSNGSNSRKRRSWRQQPESIPPVVLALDDDEKKPDNAADGKKEVKEDENEVVVVGKKEASAKKAAAISELPCMDRLREELSCAICLDICFEPSTTPCGHSFCMKCLKDAATKCGKRCPKCRQLISNSRSCTVNTVLWNTIQLLFPSETEARRTSIASSSASSDDVKQSSPRSNRIVQGGTRNSSTNGGFITQRSTRSSTSNRNFITPGIRRRTNTTGSFITQGSSTTSRDSRGFVRASQLVSSTRASVGSDQSDDAALAYRLQQEEFVTAFESEGERQPRNSSTVSAARANLRAMASRAIRLRARGWPV
ncbi:hypothetical protein ABZP36_033809 [Zizania latifolia]